MEIWLERIGRWLLAGLFVAGSVQKVADPDAAQALLAMRGWPVWLIWPALALNALGAVFLVFRLFLGPTALALAAYCAVTSLFHWIPDDPWQMSIFVKNWAIAGGLLVLAARGAERR
ncbi:DoxX family protein [Sulfitobacter sp. HNIBRBA3233]|uniref:DoxX family protein n=1 Tax=Sulfitobacter marinivivus TaxID=3158558 RepID=UPI0032E053E3